MQGLLLGTCQLFLRRASSPLVHSLISSANTAKTAMYQRPRRKGEPSRPPASRSPPPPAPPSDSPACRHSPEERPLCCRLYSIIRCTLRRETEKRGGKKCFCCDKCQLCLCLKRTVVLPNGTLSSVQKSYIEVRRLPRSEIVWLPWLEGRGRIIGKHLLWMFGHITQGSGEKLAALGASLRPGPCSFPQERLETHALVHEARLPDHF